MSELPEQLDPWLHALCDTLGVDIGTVDIEAVLDLAGEAAHAVLRPAAPLTAYVVGLATAAGADPAQAIAAARQLAQHWPA
jgi:hypothetical protein